MPQLNEILLDTILCSSFVYLLLEDIGSILDNLDDELIDYNTGVLLTQ